MATSGISLYELIDKTATVAVKFPSGGTLTVVYKPDKLTPARMQKIADQAEDDASGGFVPIVCETVIGWDLTGPLNDADDREIVAAGEAVPLDPAVMAHVPGPILGRVLRAVAEHASPEAGAPGGPSRGRSFTQAR